MRRWWILLGCVALLALVAFIGLRNARAVPIVRRAQIAMADWPRGARPATIALLADIHIGNPAMDRGRLDRIVSQVNGLAPDLVLLAGDFVSGHDRAAAAKRSTALATSLAGLHPPLGTIAVLGNHDHWTDAKTIREGLRHAGITVLANRSTVRGPLAIGGVDDDFSGHARTGLVLAQLHRLPGARLILTHSPDIVPQSGPVTLVLAGHTHCGQIYLPPLLMPSVSRFGPRYRCGVVREGRRTTIVSAGLGASNVVPLRFGAPPDIWLLTLGPG